jgi:hypothetical protein
VLAAAASTPSTAITTSSSINEKPRALFMA